MLIPALAAAEVAPVVPHWLAFFNQLVGGASRGHQYLVDSNLDWGQDLKGLAEWVGTKEIDHLNLAYFGSADPAYYGLHPTLLLGSQPGAELPRLPGWVAVSATTLHGVYLKDRLKTFYAPLVARVPEVVIGYSIFIYRVEMPWWTEDPRGPTKPPAADR